MRNESLSLLYLQELNSFNIDRLQMEPKLLLDKKHIINEEIQTLAFSNYKTFIRTAQCSREIYSVKYFICIYNFLVFNRIRFFRILV